MDSQEWILYKHIETFRDFTTVEYCSSTIHPILHVQCRVGRKTGYFVWNIVFIMVLLISSRHWLTLVTRTLVWGFHFSVRFNSTPPTLLLKQYIGYRNWGYYTTLVGTRGPWKYYRDVLLLCIIFSQEKSRFFHNMAHFLLMYMSKPCCMKDFVSGFETRLNLNQPALYQKKGIGLIIQIKFYGYCNLVCMG